MGMLPVFILGLAVGILIDRTYIEHKQATPSNVKIETMEHIIEGLKEDIRLLEITNEELRNKPKKTTTKKKKEE